MCLDSPQHKMLFCEAVFCTPHSHASVPQSPDPHVRYVTKRGLQIKQADDIKMTGQLRNFEKCKHKKRNKKTYPQADGRTSKDNSIKVLEKFLGLVIDSPCNPELFIHQTNSN